jgi:hypothetical protein
LKRPLVIYYLTEDLHNEKERNELIFLSAVGRVVVVTANPKQSNPLGLKQINVAQPGRGLRALSIWTRLCLLLGRLADSRSDLEFPSRNVYMGSALLRRLVNLIWVIKTIGWVNRALPTYDTLYFLPSRLARWFLPARRRRAPGRFARLVVHDALLLRLGPLAPWLDRARAQGIPTLANVKSWDNPFYSQLTTRASGYLVWSESMWQDVRGVQGVGERFHLAWGARPFYKLLAALDKVGPMPRLAAPSEATPLVIGYAAAFCDEYMAGYEVQQVQLLARHLSNHLPSARIRFRPYPVLPESFYAPLGACVNIDIVAIKGSAVDRFGDGREFIRFGSDEERLSYLSSCHCFLSLGTSFTIEAAIAGLPIVQFYLEPQHRAHEAERAIFARFDISDHLSRYFLGTLPVARDYADLAAQLADAASLNSQAAGAGQLLLDILGVPPPQAVYAGPTAQTLALLHEFALDPGCAA